MGRQRDAHFPDTYTDVSPSPLRTAIAPAGSNPAVLVLESKFEALRTALGDYARMVSDDFRVDATAAKLAELGVQM